MSDITVDRVGNSVGVEPLRERVRGQVLTAEDEGYDEARAVHNGMFDRGRSPFSALSRWRT